MIDVLINLVILLIICGVIWWAVTQILPLLPLPDPFRRVINVLLILILCLVIIYALLPLLHLAGGGGAGYRPLFPSR